MKISSVNRFLPYEADYELLSKFRKWETIGLWIIGVFSIVLPFLNTFSYNVIIHIINDVANFLYFFILISYYILDLYTETFLYPATARKRRKGFIDNSLGSKFLEKATQNYYKNIFFSIVALAIAYFGINNNLIAIPVLQILLSSLFITELVHHINFVVKLNQLFEKFLDAFVNIKDNSLFLQQAVLLYVEYETVLAYNKAPLSDKVYNKLNQKLTKEWEEIKERYEISQ